MHGVILHTAIIIYIVTHLKIVLKNIDHSSRSIPLITWYAQATESTWNLPLLLVKVTHK